MAYNPDKHNRKSTRLKGYDYSSAGGYFVTICVKYRKCLFGEIINGEMVLSEIGQIVRNEWVRTAEIRKNVILEEFVVMPNHFHGIIIIDNYGKGRLQNAPANVTGGDCNEPDQPMKNINKYYSEISSKTSLGTIIRGFKSATTRKINELFQEKMQSSQPLQGRFANALIQYAPNQLWQRNYHEWIIKDEKHLEKFRNYIYQNPLKWEIDSENPNKESNKKEVLKK